MNNKLLKLLAFTVIIASQSTFARSPAVENFFEITHQTMNRQRVPSDVKTAYQFKSVQKSIKLQQESADQKTGFAITTLIGLFALFALPFTTHLVLTKLNKNKSNGAQVDAADIISKYKKNTPAVENHDDEIKKAS